MFGYVLPDKPHMYFKDHNLYRAFYCGSCIQTKNSYGTAARIATNYDMTFLEVLLHSVLEVQPEYKELRCILDPRKKLTVTKNDLIDKMLALNILMFYHKLTDDVVDGKKGAKTIRGFFTGAYKKALKALPACDGIISQKYADLRALERAKCDSPDRAADPFAAMLRDCVREIVGEKYSDNLGTLCYNLGRYIYFMDALDDVDKDTKKKNYNPFLIKFCDYSGRTDFFKRHRDELAFYVNTSINTIINAYIALDLQNGRDLLYNIICRGLRTRLNQLLESEKELKRAKI